MGIKLPTITENEDEKETNYNVLFDFSGRFDDLGEDLMKLSSQEHICTIYRNEEDKIDSIMEFLKTGIVKNERSVIIVDKKSKEDILKKMKSLKGIKNLLNTSVIEFVDLEDVYGSKSDFNLARTIESFESYLEVPKEDIFGGLRIIIEILPLENKDTTMNMNMEFHSGIDVLLSNREISFFCLYNEYKFESKTLLNVIFSHSKLNFNGFLCDNSFSVGFRQHLFTKEDGLDSTRYKKTVYDIVQREITKQKRVKTDSYIQKETLKGINDSVFILDFDGNILEVNEAAYKTRGYTEEEMLSLNIFDIISSENKELFDSRIEEIKIKGEITFESTHICKNGKLLDVEFKTKIISYVDQQYILSVGRDITERKRVEKAARLGEGRILLVEDDEDVREITKIVLENYGYVVVTAENGKIALDLYNNSFDLVLTDIIMPVMGGEKLIEKLLEINPQIKCLAMTEYSDANVPEGVRVLNKPITSSKLVNYIQNELGQENSQEKIVQYKKREDGG